MITIRLTVKNRSATIARIYTNVYPPIREAAQKVVQAAAMATIAIVRDRCAKDTLFMMNHARFVLSNDRLAYEAGWFSEDFTNAGKKFYPIYPEFGTRFMRAQPSLLPAHEIVRPQMLTALRAEIQSALAARRQRGT